MKSASSSSVGATPERKRKRKTPSEPAAGDEKGSSEGRGSSDILKLKKAAFAADGLWREMRGVPGGMQRWLKAMEAASKAEEAQPQPLNKPRKKVVKTRMSPTFMEMLKAGGLNRTFSDMSPEMLACRPEWLRQEYAIRKYVDGKWAHYLGALVHQYDRLGYADDEDELTDDE